jgi:hypothetical protein
MIVARRRVHTPKYNIALVGAVNGVNQAYATPDKFDAATFSLYYNGQRLVRPEDFEISESFGAGSGYDTVTTTFAPRVGDRLFVDYIST